MSSSFFYHDRHMRGLTSYVKYEKSEEKTLPHADMNSYAEGNFKDDLLEWTHCKAGYSTQEVREEV